MSSSSDSESEHDDVVAPAEAVGYQRVRKRHAYIFTVKQKIVLAQEAYGIPLNVSKTAYHHSVSRQQLIKWHKNLQDLKDKALTNPNAKTIHNGRSIADIDIEPEIKDWILEKRAQNLSIQTRNIIQQAIHLRPNFKGGNQGKQVKWVYRFLGRNGLSIRRPTRVGQKLSHHLQEVQDDMTLSVCARLAQGGSLHGLDLRNFVNMDQTAVWFEMKSATTVDTVGARTVSVRDSGSNSKRCTVCLAVAADGTKLPPFVIFKGVPGATIERQIERDGWLACCQVKGWFDGRCGQIWIDKVLAPHFANTLQSFLLVDHFSVHTSGAFVTAVNDLGADVDFIPAGYTCVLQPCDVGVNSQFKRYIREYHQAWCMERYPLYNGQGTFPTPERADIYQWIVNAFERVTPQQIRRTFAHIGYTDRDELEVGEVDNQEIDPAMVEDNDEEVFVDPAELNFELDAQVEALLDVATQVEV